MSDQLTLIQQVCQRHQAVIVGTSGERLRIAVHETPIATLTQALRFVTDRPLEIVQCSAGQLANYAKNHEAANDTLEEPTATGLLAQLLLTALQQRASDIHIEPQTERLQIRLRTDGVLHAIPALEKHQHAPLIARLKILASMDIAEKRLPQDGQFSQHINGRQCAFRLSTLPTLQGEKAVIRLLESHTEQTTLHSLGMSRRALACFQNALALPQGMILVTGPTGSGKTSTLYGGLNALNTPERNVCSVEDPVELPVVGINQTQTQTQTGLDFQRVLRALLRQDPDVIMIGEIRDAETADIAVKAAQTGHLVMSTLHTNSTTETLLRMVQMGIPGYLLASSLKLIIAQRLLRRLCPHCRESASAVSHLPHALWPGTLPTWRAVGCSECYSGFSGRIPIFEMLPVTNALQTAIAEGQSPESLATLAGTQGMSSLFQEGLKAVSRGETTLEELSRVVGMPDEAA
ncbi:type II secretion system protein GspE [Enterobacterales bacterium CwR94]|nr:type II secretion system protein GspE [Enterobacterales bacterium CwR94]